MFTKKLDSHEKNNRKMIKSELKEHEQSINAAVSASIGKVLEQVKATEEQVEKNTSNIQDLQNRVKAVEDNPNTGMAQLPWDHPNTQFELEKLSALEKSLKAKTENTVLISNFRDKDQKPMPEILRKPIIDKVLAAIKKKGNVEALMQDGKIQQFSKITFDCSKTAGLFTREWIKQKPTNTAGHPIFAREDLPSEVRKLRAGLRKAEIQLKKYFKGINEQHKVGIQWHKHALSVDGAVVAKRWPNGEIEWTDQQLCELVSAIPAPMDE